MQKAESLRNLFCYWQKWKHIQFITYLIYLSHKFCLYLCAAISVFQAKRQQRKLNFLITQTELYAHFMARKITGEGKEHKDRILSHLDERNKSSVSRQVNGGVLEDELEDDDYGKFYKLLICILYA